MLNGINSIAPGPVKPVKKTIPPGEAAQPVFKEKEISGDKVNLESTKISIPATSEKVTLALQEGIKKVSALFTEKNEDSEKVILD